MANDFSLIGSADSPTVLAGRHERNEAPTLLDERPRKSLLLMISIAPRIQHLLVPVGTSTIGRSHECDLRIDHPSVSRRHAELVWDGNKLRVVPVRGVTNGVFLDGTPLTHATTMVRGSRLNLSRTVLVRYPHPGELSGPLVAAVA